MLIIIFNYAKIFTIFSSCFSLPLLVFIEKKENGLEPLLSLSNVFALVNSTVSGRLKMFLTSDFSPSAKGAIFLPSTFF